MFCTHCGSQIADSTIQCPHCGATNIPAQQSPQPAYQQSYQQPAPQQSYQQSYQQPYQQPAPQHTYQQLYQQHYQQSTSQPSYTEHRSNASIALGIVGIVFAFLFALVGHITSIIGIVKGAKDRNIAGIILSSIGEMCSIISSLVGMAIMASI